MQTYVDKSWKYFSEARPEDYPNEIIPDTLYLGGFQSAINL